MAQTSDEAIRILQKLIGICRDGENGYWEAADHASKPELKKFFHEKSLDRGQCARELELELRKIGVLDFKGSGSVAGALHRAWFELKDKLGAGDEGILTFVEQGENRAMKEFHEALSREEIPVDMRAAIHRVAARVETAYNAAGTLREREKGES